MEKKPTSGLAVAGLVMGIIALFSSFVPLLNLLSFPFVLLAIIFGGIGLWQTASRGKGGKGLAIAGLVLGVLALLITFVMYGAAGSSSDGASDAVSSSSGATAEQTDAAGTQSAESQAAEQTATAPDYAVTIDNCAVTEDYQGNPAIIVTFTFTNNSDEAASAMTAVHAQAFQNGVELEMAIGTGADDSGKSMNEVKPGATITYDLSYELEDMSDVTVEVEELFSWNDVLLAEQTFSLA